MPRATTKRGGARAAGPTKYDAHHKVLSQTYGDLADLRRELADSKDAVAEREEMRRAHARVLEALIEKQPDAPESALPHARRLAAIDGANESAHATLVRLLGATG